MSDNKRDLGWTLWIQVCCARITRCPEFRIAILAVTTWLLFVHVYEPWRYSRDYKPRSLTAEIGFFFWRIGFNFSKNGPLAVAIGLISIVLLLYLVGWVLRGFVATQARATINRTAPVLQRTARPLQSNRIWGLPLLATRRTFSRSFKTAAPILGGLLVSVALIWMFIRVLAHEQPPQSFRSPLPTSAERPNSVVAEELRVLTGSAIQSSEMQASPAPPPTALAKIPEVNNPRTAIELAADACRSSLQERPQNGTEAETSKVTAGHGTLTISNGNSEDSAVILSNSAMDSDDRLVYIRAGMTAIIRNIPPGQYRIQFQIGKSWDAEAERFRCVIATAMFDRTASFEENETEHEIEYADIQITLHKLSGGNARTTSITPAAFLRRRKQG